MDDDLRAMNALFATALYRAACPPSDQLLLYQVGLLETTAQAELTAHVQYCAQCQGELALIAAPPEPGPGARLAAGFITARERIRATLMPIPSAPAHALRGAATRTLTYNADAYQILIAIIPAPTPGALGQIEGQLLGANIGTGVAELMQADEAFQVGEIDELGFFAFDGVISGRYALRITLADAQIEIDDVVM